MSEAPERIWHFTDDAAEYESVSDTALPDHTEYIRADLAKPRVRPLEWLGGGDRYHTLGGEFAIEKLDTPRRDVWRLLQANFGTQYVSDFGGKDALDKAKELAQTIKARSTLEALE